MAGPIATAQYEEVRAKLAEGSTVKEAIQAVADARGMTYGAVHTTYYRTAKELGRKDRPLLEGNVSSEDLLRQAMEALTLLAGRAQELEKYAERLEKIERMLNE